MRPLALVLLVACSDPSPPTPPVAPEPSPAEPAVPAPEPTPPAPVCAEVGSLAAEVVPESARSANEAAVRQLSGGQVAEAEAALAAVVATTPGYRMARYNHACALSRLGRADDAWRELLPLLCEELPTFGPRLRADPDLAAVRARPDLDGTLDAIAALYRSAAAGGAALVALTHGPDRTDDPGTEWEESQAGSYHHATGRFVPMGPRLRERGTPGASGFGGYALNATRWDAQSGRVLSVLARGTDAELPALGPLSLSVTEAATGRELFAGRPSAEAPMVRAQLLPDAVLVRWVDLDEAPHALRVDPEGTHPAPSPASGGPVLAVGPLSWSVEARPRLEPDRGRVTLPDGRAVEIGTPRDRSRYALPTSDGDVLLVVTYLHGECDAPDEYLIERLAIGSGVRTELAHGAGYPVIEEQGGALFVQVGDVLTRYPALGAGPGAIVRAGLGLTSMADDFNPYC